MSATKCVVCGSTERVGMRSPGLDWYCAACSARAWEVSPVATLRARMVELERERDEARADYDEARALLQRAAVSGIAPELADEIEGFLKSGCKTVIQER